MKKLYFVRHGLSKGNVEGIWSGISETPLTAEGKKQAKKAAGHAKNLHIDYIVSSPLSRALDTARIVAKEIDYPVENIHINELFIERSWGILEGQPWNPDLDLDGITDLETRDTILERARLAIIFLKSLNAQNILIVSHGSIGRAIRYQLTGQTYHDQRPPSEALLPNAEILRWL